MKKLIKIGILLLIAIIWMVCIFKLSGMNAKNSNGKSTGIIGLFIEDTLDLTNEYGITNSHPNDAKIERASQLINAPLRKVIHASVYFVLAFFAMVILNIIFEHDDYYLTIIIALVVCVGFAATDEYHQTFVSGRTGQLLDVIIDSIGAIIGIAFYSTYQVAYKLGYRKAMQENEEGQKWIKSKYCYLPIMGRNI